MRRARLMPGPSSFSNHSRAACVCPRRHRVRRGSCVVPGCRRRRRRRRGRGLHRRRHRRGPGAGSRRTLTGYEEVPPSRPPAAARSTPEISRDGSEIRYALRYRHLEGAVRRSRTSTSATSERTAASRSGCATATQPVAAAEHARVPGAADHHRHARRPTCAGPHGQGIAAGEFDELVRAMRAVATSRTCTATRSERGDPRPVRTAQDTRTAEPKPPGDLDTSVSWPARPGTTPGRAASA